MKKIYFFVVLGFWSISYAQQGVIRGVVTDQNQLPLPNVNVASGFQGTTTNENGFYSLNLSSQTKQTLTFSHIGHRPALVEITLKPGEIFELNPVLNTEIDQFGEVIVRANAKAQIKGLTVLTPATIRNISGANAGVENLLLSLPGVNANNELSTQYAVRGGNYDENLVYVNEIEVYRPLLIRSGQQEGLSFLNPDLIQQVQFSAGGFEATFGDKMSSVLDIQYQTAPGNTTHLEASLLGGNASWGIEKKKWSAISGVRYRDNSLLVNQKETQTNYRPSYTDIQSFITYRASDQLVFNALVAHSLNRYNYAPTTRQTNFGTIDQPIALVVFYEGNEDDRYLTSLGALKTTWLPNSKNSFRLIISGYHAQESEHFDILAQYRLGTPNTNIGGNDLGEVMFTQGVGSQLTHGRNNLNAQIAEVKLKGKHIIKNHQIDWGLGYKKEKINDRLVEWEVVDSSGFSLRPPSGSVSNDEPYTPFVGPLEAFQNVRTTNETEMQRLTAYTQWSRKGLWGKTLYWFNLGVRTHRWQVNNENSQWVFSPRAQLSFRPKNKEQILFRLAVGDYAQPPFYRELRGADGRVNPSVKAQRAMHVVGGYEHSFSMWNRPFVFRSELYYKRLRDLNPYTLENVRLRYSADNNAKGYAYGLDLRLNGEFVPGTESWISLGLMSTEENIDGQGYIPRPTDQRFKFAMLFQDYIPSMPFLKMNLNLVYNTGLPGGSPSYANPYDFQARLRDYKRADLGIFYVLNDPVQNRKKIPGFETFALGVEIFNIFDVQNAITNTWVRDVSSKRQFGIPNFMTPRVFNVKISAGF
jgi:hypothetical protein